MGEFLWICKENKKFSLEQARKAQTESRGIALLFLCPRRYIEVGD
jgi:hypothetical protein